MKKSVGLLVVIFIGIVSFCASCKGGTNSWRHLIQALNKATQIEPHKENVSIITNYPARVISIQKSIDTLDLSHYRMKILLTGDTTFFKNITTLSLPDFIPEKQPVSTIITASYFYKDTTNIIEQVTLQYSNFPKSAKPKTLK